MAALARVLALVLAGKGILARLRSDETARAPSRPPGPPAIGDATAPAPGATETSAEEEPVAPQRSGGPGPDSPLDLEAPDWKQTAKRTLKEVKEDRVTLAAAGMAYYFFLAIFPALIALIGVMGLLEIDARGMIQSIRSTLPGEAGEVIAGPMAAAERASEGASLVAAVTGIAVSLWSASSGMVALQSGLNIAYDVPQDRKFIGKRAVALVLIVATGLLGGVPSPIFTFGESTIFTVLGWGLTLVAVAVLFSLFYFLGPNRDSPSWQWVSAGGIVGMVLWILASVGFGIYVESFGERGYAETYGSFAGVIVLILWLFLSSLAVLIGGELNAELERQSQRRKASA
jgi:membrane protein